MIKAEVVFDEHDIQINGYIVSEAMDGSEWFVQDKSMITIAEFRMLENAIKYCLEN